MHEFSVASQAVDTIIEKAFQRKAKRICSIEFLLGELCMLNGEQLIFWMKEMLNCRVDIARDATIELKQARAMVKCNQCGYEGNLIVKDQDHFYPLFTCPSCNQDDVEIKKGKECVLKKIQLEI